MKHSIVLVKRSEIPEINHVIQNGEIHHLGIHKDFRRHSLLNKYIPENARPSYSWVSLKPQQILQAHRHDTASMIIISSGTGRIFGDMQSEFGAGDVIFIPEGLNHGFEGLGQQGYWALSIQFEGAGLYEDVTNPRVSFAEEQNAFARLLDWNQTKMKEFSKNYLFRVIADPQMEKASARENLLSAIQLWSDFFQKLIFLRLALTCEEEHRNLAFEHVSEEIGHNEKLRGDRANPEKNIWDPQLVAYSAWFNWKVMTSNDAQRTALVHFVLEAGSSVFHESVKNIKVLMDSTKHFATHNEADEGHYEMGIAAIKKLSDRELDQVRDVMQEGWVMLNQICHRIGELALS